MVLHWLGASAIGCGVQTTPGGRIYLFTDFLLPPLAGYHRLNMAGHQLLSDARGHRPSDGYRVFSVLHARLALLSIPPIHIRQSPI